MNTKKLLIAVVAILFSTIGFAQRPAKLPTAPGKITYGKTGRTAAEVKAIAEAGAKAGAPASIIVSRDEEYDAPLGYSTDRVVSDKLYIKKGETFRVKYMFHPSDKTTTGLVLDDKTIKLRKINSKRGVWETTITPEKTHTYKLTIQKLNGLDSLVFPVYIIVLDPDEYEEVDAKVKEIRNNQGLKAYRKYRRELINKHCGKYYDGLVR